MANSREKGPSPERKSSFLEAWKKFNIVTGAVWLAAFAVTQNAIFGVAAAFDLLLQNRLIEAWQNRKQKAQKVGRTALQPA